MKQFKDISNKLFWEQFIENDKINLYDEQFYIFNKKLINDHAESFVEQFNNHMSWTYFSWILDIGTHEDLIDKYSSLIDWEALFRKSEIRVSQRFVQKYFDKIKYYIRSIEYAADIPSICSIESSIVNYNYDKQCYIRT